MELDIPVKVRYTKRATATSGKVTDYAEEKIQIPSDIVTELGELNLSISPTLGANNLLATQYFLDYPYACSEQTSSKAIPSILVGFNPQKFKFK